MILLGKSILTPADKLSPVTLPQLYAIVKNESSELATFQQRLRYLTAVDVNQYKRLKTSLPYVVCGTYHPPTRKKEHFIRTNTFVVDIDHLSKFGINISDCKSALIADKRVALIYTSPGGDGFKLFFELADDITDINIFSTFYKAFCTSFAALHNLSAAIDLRTNDVTRCCFIAHDSGAWLNPAVIKVSPSQVMEGQLFPVGEPAENPNPLTSLEKENQYTRNQLGISPAKTNTLTNDVLVNIKDLVGVKPRPKEKNHAQPKQLADVMEQVSKLLAEVNITIVASTPISYGRQVRFGNNITWAEVNIFYGKKGISIVPTTKSGSNRQLCNAVTVLLQNHFY